MSFFVLPPEVNSALMKAGAGSGPLLAAAEAWDGLAAELGAAATSFGSVTSGLVGGSWQGASAAAMAAAAAPYAGWLNAAATSAEAAAGQARAVVGAFEAALAATVDPFVIAANRSELVSLALSNLFGQNTAAIAAAEAEYELMWAQDVAAMAGYHLDASAVVSALQAFSQPVQSLAGLGGLSATANSVTTAGQQFLANLGVANLGGGNIGLDNAGSNNFSFGNTGVGYLGLHSSGIGNIGLFNPGIYGSGISHWGQASTGFLNGAFVNRAFLSTGSAAAVDIFGFPIPLPNVNFDIFPITLPLDLNLNGGIGPITIQPIQILPTIPLNFNQTFMLGPLTVPPIQVPPIPLGGITIPIDVGPLTISPITLIPAVNIPNQTINLPGFDLAPGGIKVPNLLNPSPIFAPIVIHLNVNPITLNLGLSTPGVTLFPGGLSIPDNPIHLDVGASAGTGGFTIPGFSLPLQAIPLTISIAGQIDGFSTPAITIDTIPTHLHAKVSADQVVPIFPLPTIPLHIDIDGSVGPVNVHPISVPAAHASITNATVSVGSFTIPQITIPHIPLNVAGTVGLGQNTISAMNILDPLTITAQLGIGPITGPFVDVPGISRTFGTGNPAPANLDIKPFTVSLGLTPSGSEILNLGTTALAIPNIDIPAQTPLTLDLVGGLDPITLFPGGLTFPVNSVSLTNFSVGSNPFIIFPNGFRVDQFPFNIHSTVLSPTPGTTGSIGPIHIPAVPAIPPIHVGGTGSVNLNLGFPDIPTPAINMGLFGNLNYSFVTSQPINISPFGATGSLSINKIDVAINFSKIDVAFNAPVVLLGISGPIAPFSITQSISGMTVPLDFTTGPITIAPLSLGGSIPIEFVQEILTPGTVKGITHTQSIPLNFALDTELLSIPETTIPAIPIGGTTTVSGVGLLNAVAANLVNAGSQLNTAANAGVAWLNHQLMNAGPGNTGIYNLGNGNLGDLNFGDGNIGSYNLGGGNIGVANIGWANSALGTLMGHNLGFGNTGSGNIGFGNTGSGNIGIGNTGNGNMGIGLTGDNLNGFGGWNSGTGNVGLFNSGTGNWGLFNSGSHNNGIANSGQANIGLFNAGTFNTGVANAGSHNMGILNAGKFNTGAYNPGNANIGVFNSGHSNMGIANTGNGNTGVFISGNHSTGVLWTSDNQGPFGAGLGINILDINQNLGPIHIDPIHVAGLPININETFNIGPFTIPQIDVPAIPLDIHQSFTLPAITLFEGINIPAQTNTIPFNLPAGTASTLQLPVIKLTGTTHFGGFFDFGPSDYFIGQSSNPTSTTGQPTTGLTINFGASGARTGSVALNIPAINIPKIATSPLPLTIDVQGGIPAFTLFPGGLSIPENPIPVNLVLSGGLQPFTIFPNGYTIDPIPLHLKLDATLLNPIDGIPPSLNLVDFHLSGGMGQVTIPDIPIPTIQLGLNGHLNHGAFTIPSIPIPNIPVHITGNVGLGPIGIPSQTIAAITGNPLATIHFNASQSAGMTISQFVIWTPTNAAWDPATTGPAFIAFGTNWGSGLFPLPQGPLIFGGSTQNPFTVTVKGGSLPFNTPAILIDKIPLTFDVPGGVDAFTLFPNKLTFPANNLVDLNLSAGSGAFTIPARTIQAIPAELHAIVKLATPDSLLPPYKLLYVTATGGVGPAVFPSFHIPSIPLGLNLDGGIGPITIPSISTPEIHLGLDPTADLGPITVQPFTINPFRLNLGIDVSDITSTASTSDFAFRVSGIGGAIINLGSTSASHLPGFSIEPFNLQTPPGGFPGLTIPVDPIHIGLPLSVTIPSLTFPGLTIPRIPLGIGLSGALPAFDLPSITINRIPINLSGPLTLL
ncbi:PPE family protein PPE34 [Mycobacterium simulans]|uniref:PPE family protein PPE34 n=1 Tax=Mycobacterium simulans TaxID=627089 RepID=A0A7Z7IMB5_9MYCO|nr:PPE family protein [Mycobacterium simulans]SOJ56224.1 PPE family protein PPE34 [Mycobacterium simulans]